MYRILFLAANLLLYWILCGFMGNMYNNSYCTSNPKCDAYVYGTGCVKNPNSRNGSVHVECRKKPDTSKMFSLDSKYNSALGVYITNLILMVTCIGVYLNKKDDVDMLWVDLILIIITSLVFSSAWFHYCLMFHTECGQDTKCVENSNTITEVTTCSKITEDCSSDTTCTSDDQNVNILKVQCTSNVSDDDKEETSNAYKGMIVSTVLWSIVYIGLVIWNIDNILD
tara:strand:+ start:254 stop:931 length:678 start_codon:yes stop_codon:yes gene_type:complete